MDGEVITAMRTAVVSAIATKQLAERTDTLAVLGSGVQARTHIEAFSKLFPVKKVHMWNHRVEGAEKLADHVRKSLPGVEVKVWENPADCVAEADVIVTATFATEPILEDVPMKPWVHINCKSIQRMLPVLVFKTFSLQP